MSISDNDIASYYPSMSFFYEPKPRSLTLEVLAPPHRQLYSVRVNNGSWWDDKVLMEEWCCTKFGEHSKLYNNPRWKREGYDFRFKNKGDAVMFMLRWG